MLMLEPFRSALGKAAWRQVFGKGVGERAGACVRTGAVEMQKRRTGETARSTA